MISRVLTILVTAIATVGLGEAQGIDPGRRQHYLFFAPGTSAPEIEPTVALGGGAEWFVHKGLALGVDGGYLTVPECFECGIGLISVDASHHFFPRDRARKVVPFVTGGYTLAFREGMANLVNFGGGFNYWWKPSLGLRVEIRDHVHPRYWEGHLLSFRVGLAIR